MEYFTIEKIGFYTAVLALILLLYYKKRKQKHDIDKEDNNTI